MQISNRLIYVVGYFEKLLLVYLITKLLLSITFIIFSIIFIQKAVSLLQQNR